VLALALGGRSVQEWRATMSRSEFMSWAAFYKLHPFDDLHRYHRPAAMVASAMGGGSISDRLEWLHPQPKPHAAEHTSADVATLRAFGIE